MTRASQWPWVHSFRALCLSVTRDPYSEPSGHILLLLCFSRVWLWVTLWTVAHQAPLSMGFSRQEYWSGLPCPPPGESSSGDIEWYWGALCPPSGEPVPSGSLIYLPPPSSLQRGWDRGLWSPGLSILFCLCSWSLLQTWPRPCPGLTRIVSLAEAFDLIPETLTWDDLILSTAGQPTFPHQGLRAARPPTLGHSLCLLTLSPSQTGLLSHHSPATQGWALLRPSLPPGLTPTPGPGVTGPSQTPGQKYHRNE